MIVSDYATTAQRLEAYTKALKEPLITEKNHDQSLDHVVHGGLFPRSSTSIFLKSTYPAGFGSLKAQKQKFFNSDGSLINRSTFTPAISNLGSSQPKESYMNWTRGEENMTEDDTEESEDFDPYADVAGPYYRELMKLRAESGVNYILHGRTSDCSLSAIRAQLHRPERINQKSKYAVYDSSENFKVYNVPCALPNLNPALLKSKSGSAFNMIDSKKSNYNDYIETQKSNKAESVWLKKGNNLDHNYSAYDFKSEEKTRDPGQSVLYPLQKVPRILPPVITVQMCTLSQMLRSHAALDERSFLFRQLSSEIDFSSIREMIRWEIIGVLLRAFECKTPGDESNIQANVDDSQIDLSLQYFIPYSSCWRALSTEQEWQQAKQISCSEEETQGERSTEIGTVSIMYTLAPASEQHLIQQMKETWRRRQQGDRAGPHISVQSLTDALSAAEGKKRHSYPSPSERAPPSAEDLFRRANKEKRQATARESAASNRSVPITVRQSILLPNQVNVTRVQRDRLVLQQKQDALAANLEQKLLKTRF